jgi:Integrase zinc binding domain/Chromo (CHRromatin Organisation MOdifier) domain/Integrase core domain
VPKDNRLRTRIIKMHHDPAVAGHPGQWKTLELVSRNYWWPRISVDVKDYVKGCSLCQRSKNVHQSLAAPLKPNTVHHGPWKNITADFITGLPTSGGYDSILVVVCRHTKQAHFIGCNDTVSAEELARLYRDNVWKLHGLPDTITTDRGPQFSAEFTRELNRMLGIQTKLSTAYHPETDGQTERVNQELERYLRWYVDYRQGDWSEFLATAEFAYNNKIHSATQASPFFLNYGLHPRMGVEPRKEGKVQSATEFAADMKRHHEEAEGALVKAREEMEYYANLHRGPAPSYQVGEKVMLSTKDLSVQGRPSRKLAEKWVGPYEILKTHGPNAVKLRLPRSWRLNPVVNVSRVKPWSAPIEGQVSAPPPPIEIEGEEEWEVEQVLDARVKRGKLDFLVRWKGFEREADTWEPEANLENSPELVKVFYQKNPRAPRPTISSLR